jgi:hypothetical protein
MKDKLHIQFSPTRLKQIKKIALSGSKAKLKILNGKLEEGFHLLKSTAQKLKSFATDLADRIPQALAAKVSLDLFSHFENKSSKRLGIPKGIVLGGVLALMSVLPAVGQTIDVTSTADAGAGSLRQAIIDANANGAAGIIRLADGTTYTIASNLPTIVDAGVGGTLQIICTGTSNAIIDGNNAHRPITMDPNSDLTLSNITVQNGRATANNGGGIYNLQGDLTISDCLITNNNATGGTPNGKGGGIFSRASYASASVLIQNSTVSGNSSQREGGGIFNGYGATMTIFSSTISGNSSLVNGAGLVNTRSSMMTITSSTILGNTSSQNGGALAGYRNCTTHISNSMISGNTANRGGAIFQNGCILTISSSTVTNNEATGSRGGGIESRAAAVPGSASVLIQNSTISLNSASTTGGGVFNDDNSTLTIVSSSFSGNTADKGGGIYNYRGDLTLSNSIITNNQATDVFPNGTGGGICNEGDGVGISVLIKNSSISGNTASLGGGISNSNSSFLTISSSSISGNISSGQGGGLFNTGSDLIIQASSFTANQSTNEGGGIRITGLLAGGQNVLIQNTTISGNTCTNSFGGGIYHRNVGAGVNNITLQHVTFSNNSGLGTGGFRNTGSASITLQNTIIANSTGADFQNSGGGTLTLVTASIVEDGSLVHANVITGNPMLNALSGGVHTLQAGSPAIDSGYPVISTDQLGVLRGVCFPDIGAVERAGGASLVFSTSAGATNTWIGCTNSDWNTASNWSNLTVPTASDVVYVPIEAANQLIIDEEATCAKMIVQIGAKCLVDYNAGGKLLVKF